MPNNKQKRKTRRERLAITPPHPSTRGDRELSSVGRMCANCPQFLYEIAELRSEGQWVMSRGDRETEISLRRLQQKRNSANAVRLTCVWKDSQLEVKGEAQGEVVDVTEEVFAFSFENTDGGQSSSGQEQQ